MLLNALFYVTLIALTASSMLGAGMAMAHAAAQRMAARAAVAAYQRAAAAAQQRLAEAMQQGGVSQPLPSFTPLPAACVDVAAACAYRSSASIALLPPQPAPDCSASTLCAHGEEANGFVAESRIVAAITVNVTGADGSTLYSRSSQLAFRTFAAPPYAVLDAPGDDGGVMPATPNPCASPPAQGDGTAVRVAYRNAASGACSDGSSWRVQGYSGAPPSGW